MFVVEPVTSEIENNDLGLTFLREDIINSYLPSPTFHVIKDTKKQA